MLGQVIDFHFSKNRANNIKKRETKSKNNVMMDRVITKIKQKNKSKQLQRLIKRFYVDRCLDTLTFNDEFIMIINSKYYVLNKIKYKANLT